MLKYISETLSCHHLFGFCFVLCCYFKLSGKDGLWELCLSWLRDQRKYHFVIQIKNEKTKKFFMAWNWKR